MSEDTLERIKEAARDEQLRDAVSKFKVAVERDLGPDIINTQVAFIDMALEAAVMAQRLPKSCRPFVLGRALAAKFDGNTAES